MRSRIALLVLAVCFTDIAFGDDRSAKEAKSAVIRWDDPGQIIEAVARRSAYWTSPSSLNLRTLRYTYLLGHQQREVTLEKGGSNVRYSLWQGCSLRTGIHALLREPDRFSLEVSEGTDDTSIRVSATVKGDGQPVGIEVGNGIDGTWHGYYSHSTREVVLLVDRERLVPLEERSGQTTLRFGDWKQISQDRWVPGTIDILSGQTRYRMHFAWMGDAVWLLTRGESVSREGTTVVARTGDVTVNDKAVARPLSEDEQRWREAGDVVRQMLSHNQAWLSPSLDALDSIEYTFLTVREDIREKGFLNREGVAVLEVMHDGQGKMGDRLGDRRIALPTKATAYTNRHARFAKITPRPRRLKNQPADEQYRHYARIGCQFDLPLFRFGERISGAQIEVEDGQWKGRECVVARVSNLGRDVYFGAGTMFGFSSWSYVHHIRPAYELIYIDKQNHLPIHETLVDSRRERTYEIDFADFVEVEKDNWAPLSIRIEAEDYFNADYRFQLAGGKHWMLKEVVSWFDASNKSRGVVENLRVNQRSELQAAAMKQVEASRLLFSKVRDERRLPIAAVPIVFGKRVTIGPYAIVLTVAGPWKTAVKVETRDSGAASFVPLLLLDDQGRPLFAARATLSPEGDWRRGEAALGYSRVLGEVRSIAIPNVPPTAGTDHSVAVTTCRWNEPIEINIPDLSEGKTRAYEVRLTRNDDGVATAKMSVASQAGPAEFLLDLSVALLDDEGRILTAGLNTGTMLVKRGIVEAEYDIELGGVIEPSKATQMVIAVTAGDVIASPMGSTWGRYSRTHPVIPLEQLLAADDDACRKLGLSSLAKQVRIDKEIFDNLYDRKRLRERGGTRQQILGPHVADLARIAEQAQDDAVLADSLRLLGHAGDRQHVDVVRARLSHGDGHLADVAAVAAAMLGAADGFHRLSVILHRRQPSWEKDREARRAFDSLETDVLIALATVGDERSIKLLGDTLQSDLESLAIATDDKNREYLSGRPDRIKRIVSVLGYSINEHAVPWLTAAAGFFAEHPKLGDKFDQIPLAEALVQYEEKTRELVATKIAQGHFAYIRSFKVNDLYDPYYVPAVHKLLLNPDATAWTAHQGVTYLWNVGTPEALDVLRDAHARGAHQADTRTRMHVCEALAALGDDRGLSDAFEVLTEAFEMSEQPTDKRQLKEWEDRREDLEEGAKDILARVSKSSIAAFVESRMQTKRPAERRALVELLWYLPETPKSIVPALQDWQSDGDAALSEELGKLLDRE